MLRFMNDRRPLMAWAAGCCALLVAGCSGSDQENRRPSANAGPDVVARFQSDVMLSGRDSEDADGPVMQYLWQQVSGPDVPAQVVNNSTIRLKLPAFDQETRLVWALTVTDNQGETSTDQVVITAKPPEDPNRFLTFTSTPTAFDVQVPLATSQAALNGVVNFDLVLKASASYQDVRGIQRETLFSVQTQRGQWTPAAQADGLVPRFTLAIPVLDLEQLVDANDATRNAIDVVYELSLENLTAAVDYQIQVLDAEGVVVDVASLDPAALVALADGQPVRMAADRLRDALKVPIAESAQTATAYYQAIDPQGRKTTLTDWLQENGFDQNDAVEAKYINAADLGFGRHMWVRRNDEGHVFAVVTNYPNMDSLIKGINIIATVAMEYSPGPNGGEPFTKFYTFVPNRETGQQERVLSMDFDGRGEKYTPGNCLVCHGGRPQPLVGGVYPNDGNVGARFLPWDVDSFAFSDGEYEGRLSPEPLGVTRASQEPAFKWYNQTILATNLTPSSRDLIHGWYGGESMPRATLDASYVPLAWRSPAEGGPATNPETASALYREVFAPNCRACHTGREGENGLIGFASYQNFADHRELILQYVFDEGLMPAARITMDKFWVNPHGKNGAQLLAEHFSVNSVERQPGQPQAVISPTLVRGDTRQTLPNSQEQTNASVARGEVVQLSARDSRFAESLQWTLTGPSGSAASLVSSSSQTTSFRTDRAGNYDLQLAVTGRGERAHQVNYRFSVDNRVPVAGNFSASIKEGQEYLIDVFASPSSLGDGAQAQHRIVDVVWSAGSVTVDQAAGTLRFIPSGATGGEILYRLEDVDGDRSELGEVVIAVSALPVAAADTLDTWVGTASADRTRTGLLPRILSNDNPGAGDIALTGVPARLGGSLSNGVNDCRSQGVMTLVGGDLRYTPPKACTGTETWRYTIRDRNGDTASANIRVNIRISSSGAFSNVTSVITAGGCTGCHYVSPDPAFPASGQIMWLDRPSAADIHAQIVECNPGFSPNPGIANQCVLNTETGFVNEATVTLTDPGIPRVDLTQPANLDRIERFSLILSKPSQLGVVHQGGQVLTMGSSEYLQLREWLLEGAHGPSAMPLLTQD